MLHQLLVLIPPPPPQPPRAPTRPQVAEVTAQNEYQLKLRDLALNEKVRELTDKAAAEAAAAAERCVKGLLCKGRN